MSTSPRFLDNPEWEAAFDTLRLAGVTELEYAEAMQTRVFSKASSADTRCEGCRDERGCCDQQAIVRARSENDHGLYCPRHMQMASVDWQALGFMMPFQRLDDGRMIFTLGRVG
jgi:hypothetical protein